MIVKMKKITLLLSAKHRDTALRALRKLGVLHIHEIQTPVADDIQSLEVKIENVNKAYQILNEIECEQKNVDNEKAQQYVEDVISYMQQNDLLSRELNEYLEIKKWYDNWGGISKASVETLKDAGVFVRLYVADKNALKENSDKQIHVANENQGTVYLALFSDSPEEKLDYKEEHIPDIEYADVEKKIVQIKQSAEKIKAKLFDVAQYKDSLIAYRADLEKKLELNRVKYGMGAVEEIAYLQGFCPVDNVNDIKKQADKDGWAYLVEDPEDPADVPTLTRNPKWLKIIKPLFDFMGTLPGYEEQDVSFVFLAFFSVFYAMIIGDAGYGFVFLLSTMYFGRNVKKGSRDFIYLMYLLSFTTIVWGTITGTWFGSEAISNIPLLKMFIIEPIYSFNEKSTEYVMLLSFIIGATHLSVARLLAAFKKINSITALAEVGWVFVLWAVFFVAQKLVLFKDLPGFTMPLLLTGVVIILLFANFQKNIVKGILLTLSNLPLDIISSFSDVVSYIRLFAVGFASVIVASSFNTMAIGSGINSIISGIIAAIVLLFGHALNMALCGMSVLVHGVRLNMLEFSGHVGVQWTGKPYKPFKD